MFARQSKIEFKVCKLIHLGLQVGFDTFKTFKGTFKDPSWLLPLMERPGWLQTRHMGSLPILNDVAILNILHVMFNMGQDCALLDS